MGHLKPCLSFGSKVKIFPELHPASALENTCNTVSSAGCENLRTFQVYSQMAENLDQWKVLWVGETSPSDEAR